MQSKVLVAGDMYHVEPHVTRNMALWLISSAGIGRWYLVSGMIPDPGIKIRYLGPVPNLAFLKHSKM